MSKKSKEIKFNLAIERLEKAVIAEEKAIIEEEKVAANAPPAPPKKKPASKPKPKAKQTADEVDKAIIKLFGFLTPAQIDELDTATMRVILKAK